MVRARREAACRERQRQTPEYLHLGLHPVRAAHLQRREHVARQLRRQHPAAGAQFVQQLEGLAVVDIQVGAGDEARLSRRTQHVEGGGVVGLDREAAIRDGAAQRAQFGLGLDERERGQHHFLAGLRELLRHRQPVIGTQRAPLAAHHLAEIDDVHRPAGGLGVEIQHAFAFPVIKNRPEGKFHAHCQPRSSAPSVCWRPSASLSSCAVHSVRST